MNKLKETLIFLKGDITGEYKERLINCALTRKDREDGIKDCNNIVENLEDTDLVPIHFFIVTPLNNDITLFGDIMRSCYANPLGTIILLKSRHGGYSYTPSQFKKILASLDKISKIGGVNVLNDFDFVIDFIINSDLVKIEESKLSKVATEMKAIIKEIETNHAHLLLPNKSNIQNIKRIVFSYLAANANT